jgi:hypothetical protein
MFFLDFDASRTPAIRAPIQQGACPVPQRLRERSNKKSRSKCIERRLG